MPDLLSQLREIETQAQANEQALAELRRKMRIACAPVSLADIAQALVRSRGNGTLPRDYYEKGD